jgi:hypothetical protein
VSRNSSVPDWVELTVHWLDDRVRVPGTRITFGLDAIIGFLLPGIGDAVTTVAAVLPLWLAIKSGVPRVVVFRMLLNVVLDAALGAVPVLGDVFDVAFKANRKNLTLLRGHLREGLRPAPGDYGVLVLVVTGVLIAALVPLGVVLVVAAWLCP